MIDLVGESAGASAVHNIPLNVINIPEFIAESVQKGHIPVQSTSHQGQPIVEDISHPEQGQRIAEEILRRFKLRCEECGKLFPAPWALKRHMTVHTGQKDWYCGLCDKHFTRKENLKMHTARYHL